MPTEIKIYISIFAGFVLCLILIKGFGKNKQEQADISSGVDNVTIILDGESLKIKLVAGMFWTVESNKPIRINLKDGYLESDGDSIAWGFEYGFSRGIRAVSSEKQIVEMAVDFDDLVDKIKAKHEKGESWFIGSPLTESQYEYLKQMIDALPDTVYNVPKDTTSKKLN